MSHLPHHVPLQLPKPPPPTPSCTHRHCGLARGSTDIADPATLTLSDDASALSPTRDADRTSPRGPQLPDGPAPSSVMLSERANDARVGRMKLGTRASGTVDVDAAKEAQEEESEHTDALQLMALRRNSGVGPWVELVDSKECRSWPW